MPYRAVSLDLWYTAYLRDPDQDARWEAARLEAIGELLVGADGGPVPGSTVRAADDAAREALRRAGRNPDEVAPTDYLRDLATRLRGRLASDPAQASTRYSLAGFDDDPPVAHPDLGPLARSLRAIGLPLAFLSNTHRTASALAGFFGERRESYANVIVASCDVGVRKPDGRIFRALASRLGFDPSEILHVGDRYDSDVVGARNVGMGAALFTGSWSRYPPGGEEQRMVARTPFPASEPRLHSLLEILDLGLAASGD